jgi:uncharacterized protein YfaQ (DUF2300 family)
MKSRRMLAALLLALAWAPTTHAEDPLASALEGVSKDQIAAFNTKDVAATMALAHTKSPTYEGAKETLTEYFKDQNLQAEQVSFQYIGHDDEFAYARVKTKVTSPGTEGFEGNQSDTVTMFHQEGGKWKVWDAYLFGTTLEK